MKLVYDKMEIHDFRSIKELKFFFNRRTGVHFVAGRNDDEPELESNGAGKSTLFNALCWLQYGRTADDEKGPDVMPWGAKHGPHGTLTFYQDGHAHCIARSSSPNRIQLDGKDVTQDTLDKDVLPSFEVYRNTIHLAQGRPLFLDMAASDKMELLSTAAHLNDWDTRAQEAGLRYRILKNEAEKDQRMVSLWEQQAVDLKKMREQLRKQSDEWEAEQEKLQQESDKQIAEIRKQTDKLQSLYNNAVLAHDSAETELKALAIKMQQTNDYIRINQGEIAKGNALIDSAASQLALLKKKKCPTCGQDVHSRLPRYQELLVQANPGPVHLLLKINTQLQKEEAIFRKSFLEFRSKSNSARAEMDLQSPRLAELATKTLMLSNRKEQRNPYRDQLQALRRRIEQLDTDIKRHTDVVRGKLATAERAEFWSRAFKDIKLDIIEDLLKQLEICCSLMLTQVGLVGWKLEFAIERETKSGTTSRGIDVTVVPFRRKPGRRVKFKSWSGGEAQRLRLVGALALSEILLARAGIDPNLQILDEPTRGLAAGGIDDLVDELTVHASRLDRTVLLADHHAIESGAFAGSLVVTRQKGGETRVVSQ